MSNELTFPPGDNRIKREDWDRALRILLAGDYDLWSWTRNTQCKYVTLSIDTRSGRGVFLDRDDNRISLDQLLAQYARKTPALKQAPVGPLFRDDLAKTLRDFTDAQTEALADAIGQARTSDARRLSDIFDRTTLKNMALQLTEGGGILDALDAHGEAKSDVSQSGDQG